MNRGSGPAAIRLPHRGAGFEQVTHKGSRLRMIDPIILDWPLIDSQV